MREPDEAARALDRLLDELLDLEPFEREARLARLASQQPELAVAARRVFADAERDGPLATPVAGLASLLVEGDGLGADRESSRIGERVGPYRLTAELGRGGMGAVYAADRVEGGFEQRVAVKILKRGLDSEEVLRRFLAERRILARLEHPHIARLIDGGLTADGLPWFAMERVEGRPITEHVAAAGLGVKERLALFLEVCEAVAFAHGQRVVHRDLKPSNVLVDGRGQVRLLDFGIAKLLEPGGEGQTRTRAAETPMTPQYAAPEQLAGGEVTEATDVWQLGKLLGMVAATPLPKDVERIVARASHEEPGRRYGSVGALAEDVRRHLDGRPVLARGDSPAYRVNRFLRRHRVSVVAGMLAVLAGVAGTLLSVRSRAGDVVGPVRFELVSTFPGSHRQASFAPDGRRFAFLTEDAQGRPQVFVKDLAGGEPRQLTAIDPAAHRPRWSPRGGTIVFDVPGRGIWAVAETGGPPRLLLAEGFNVNFSPDGARLVYEVATGMWTADADGSNPRRLGDELEGRIEKEYAFVENTPAFSTDGREVVYFQGRDMDPEVGDLWSVPLAGGAPRRLTIDQAIIRHPIWMPDGSGIVYSSARRGGLTLWLLPAGGGEPRPLTTGSGEDTEAAVSADGRRILYTSARNLLRIMWLDPRTGERRQLLERRGALTHPSFSPDGRRLVVFQREGPGLHLWTVGADGSDPGQLSRGEDRQIVPNWSPDGAWIYFYSMSPPVGLRRMPPAGGDAETVVDGWRFPVQHGGHVSPDSSRAAYTLLEHSVPLATRVRELRQGAEQTLAQPILWPRWSPDGTLLAGRARSREVVLCPASGEACRSLGVEGTEPRWSRDGREVYFVRYSGYQGSRDPRFIPLWKVNVDGSAPAHVADLDGAHPTHFFYDVGPNGEVAWAEFVAGRQELWLAELP